MKRGREVTMCMVYGCGRPTYCYGRCVSHWHEMKKFAPALFKKLQGMTWAERAIELQKMREGEAEKHRRPFEWEGDEKSLAAQCRENGDHQ